MKDSKQLFNKLKEMSNYVYDLFKSHVEGKDVTAEIIALHKLFNTNKELHKK